MSPRSLCQSFSPAVVVKMIEDVFQAHLEGEEPFHIENFWHQAYGRGYSGRPDPSLVGVISGLEIAPIGQPASHQPSHRQAGRPLKGWLNTLMGIGDTGMFFAAKPFPNSSA